MPAPVLPKRIFLGAHTFQSADLPLTFDKQVSIPKSEIRSTKSETSTKVQNPNDQDKNVSDFEIRSFEFVSSFDIRISNF